MSFRVNALAAAPVSLAKTVPVLSMSSIVLFAWAFSHVMFRGELVTVCPSSGLIPVGLLGSSMLFCAIVCLRFANMSIRP